MGLKLESLVIQYSRPQERGDAEEQLIADGLIPFTAFANGPDNAMLLAARPADFDAAFSASADLAEGLGAQRLALRMRSFEDASYAIETDMKYVSDPATFARDILFLFVDALHQYGFSEAAALRPCAVRYERAALELPDFGEPPPEGEAAPDAGREV